MAVGPRRRITARFRNRHVGDGRSALDFLRWRWERLSKEIPPPGSYRFSVVRSDPPKTDSVTWVGQSTLLLRIGKTNILTDPHFSSRASPLSWAGPRRAAPPGLAMEELPRIDLVLISHDHYDHLDARTIRWLTAEVETSPRFVVPRGLKRWFAKRGVDRVDEIDWWQGVRVADALVTAVPVQHWSRRGLTDAFRSLWAGYRVEVGGYSFLFIGDTGYSPHFEEIRSRFGTVDLAALPIGAYAPRWFMKPYHMTPEEAVQAHLDLGGPPTVALHWGTFSLADEPLDEPPRRLRNELVRRNLPEGRFRVLRHGETLSLTELGN